MQKDFDLLDGVALKGSVEFEWDRSGQEVIASLIRIKTPSGLIGITRRGRGLEGELFRALEDALLTAHRDDADIQALYARASFRELGDRLLQRELR